jgi:hypothetical protein
VKRALAAAAVVGAVCATGVVPAAAGSQEEPDRGSGAPTLTLRSQPAWTPIGGNVPIVLDVRPPEEDLSVRYSVYSGLTSRTAFDETLTGTGLGPALARNSVGYDTLPLADDGGRVLLLGLQSSAEPSAPRLPVEQPGVYPLEISLLDGDGSGLHSFVTYLVVLEPGTAQDPVVGEELRLAWVWPLQAAPALLPDGTPDPAVVDELLPSGRIGRQVRVLAQNPGVAVTLAPGPETVDTWTSLTAEDARLEPSLDALRVAAGDHELLTGPYVGLDVPAIVAEGLGDRVGPELVTGTAALVRRLDDPLNAGIAVVRPVSQTALETLRGLGIDRVFIDADALQPETFRFTPARPFALQVGNTQVVGAASDPGLEALLTENGPPALRAQQLLAGLSIVALEQPNVARGVALVNPPDWNPPLRFLEATLAGLVSNPLLRPIDADEYFGLGLEPEADGAGILVRELAPSGPPAEAPVSAEAYDRAYEEQDAFRAFLGAGDPKLATGDRALQVVLSSAYQSDLGRLRANAELENISRVIDAELALIRVPEEGTITLTAREGDVPVTFLNETGRDVKVRVELQSQQLQFPDGTEREVTLPPKSSTVRFAVEARAPGNYPLTLHMTSVDGGLDIQSTRVHVRSTFVSGVGKFLTIGAALFLGLWWALDIRYRRKLKQAATTA